MQGRHWMWIVMSLTLVLCSMEPYWQSAWAQKTHEPPGPPT